MIKFCNLILVWLLFIILKIIKIILNIWINLAQFMNNFLYIFKLILLICLDLAIIIFNLFIIHWLKHFFLQHQFEIFIFFIFNIYFLPLLQNRFSPVMIMMRMMHFLFSSNLVILYDFIIFNFFISMLFLLLFWDLNFFLCQIFKY